MSVVLIEHFTPVFTADDERKIGRLAIESRLIREAVLVWMEENKPGDGRKPRQEDAPMWHESAKAWNRFNRACNDLLGLEDV